MSRFRFAALLIAAPLLIAAEPPSAAIASPDIKAKIYLPDAQSGFYRGTRFDWSGVVYSLTYKGHEYYGPWFTQTDPTVHDFIYKGTDIVAGPCSAITGPVDEFRPVGYDDAKPGANFLKIGIGALRKPDSGKYDNYRVYDIAVPGKWSVKKTANSVEFTQELTDPSTGYAYIYKKTVALTNGKPEMVLSHSLKNTGKKAIETTVYNHNFLTLDKQAPGPGMSITVPFPIQAKRTVNEKLAKIEGNKLTYINTLQDRDVVFTNISGFGKTAKDHEIRIESTRAGAGIAISADKPLESENLWSIRSVVAMEPFIAITIVPGQTFDWTTRYLHYTLPAGK